MNTIHQLRILAAAFALALTFASTGAHAAGAPASHANVEKHKVVFQVSTDDPKLWSLTLNNVKNVQQELGAQNVDVEIVAYGPGISMLKSDSTAASRIDETVRDGVKVVACENTMKAQNLSREKMLASVGFVLAGVVELMKKQKEGYAYIRP